MAIIEIVFGIGALVLIVGIFAVGYSIGHTVGSKGK